MISTKGRYGLRVMLDLAQHQDQGNISLQSIAQRQDISKKYLEIIVRDLVSAGFISGVSGKGGGYRLCRKPGDYTIGEILEQLEGTLASVACLMDGAEKCSRAEECLTLPLWKEYDQMVRNFFYKKRLSDLIRP